MYLPHFGDPKPRSSIENKVYMVMEFYDNEGKSK